MDGFHMGFNSIIASFFWSKKENKLTNKITIDIHFVCMGGQWPFVLYNLYYHKWTEIYGIVIHC